VRELVADILRRRTTTFPEGVVVGPGIGFSERKSYSPPPYGSPRSAGTLLQELSARETSAEGRGGEGRGGEVRTRGCGESVNDSLRNGE